MSPTILYVVLSVGSNETEKYPTKDNTAALNNANQKIMTFTWENKHNTDISEKRSNCGSQIPIYLYWQKITKI